MKGAENLKQMRVPGYQSKGKDITGNDSVIKRDYGDILFML